MCGLGENSDFRFFRLQSQRQRWHHQSCQSLSLKGNMTHQNGRFWKHVLVERALESCRGLPHRLVPQTRILLRALLICQPMWTRLFKRWKRICYDLSFRRPPEQWICSLQHPSTWWVNSAKRVPGGTHCFAIPHQCSFCVIPERRLAAAVR